MTHAYAGTKDKGIFDTFVNGMPTYKNANQTKTKSLSSSQLTNNADTYEEYLLDRLLVEVVLCEDEQDEDPRPHGANLFGIP